jgi:DNA-binding Lrp family transcriptional regulator
MQIDEKEQKILKLLKENSKLTTSQISKKTKIPITTIHNRIKKLEKTGIIKNYTLNLDFEKIEKPIKAFMFVSINQKKTSQEEIGKKIKNISEIEFVDIITGTTDIIVQARTKTINELNELITNKLRNIEGVDKTETMIVLKEVLLV